MKPIEPTTTTIGIDPEKLSQDITIKAGANESARGFLIRMAAMAPALFMGIINLIPNNSGLEISGRAEACGADYKKFADFYLSPPEPMAII